MIMDETKEKIRDAIKSELKNALEQGSFVDAHHAYAILKEEIDEANFYIKKLKFSFNKCLWTSIKSDHSKGTEEHFKTTLINARLAMGELAQAASVCEKALQQLFEEGV